MEFYLNVIDKESNTLSGLINLIYAATNYSLAETDMRFIENDISTIGVTAMSIIIDDRCKNIDYRILVFTTNRDKCIARIIKATTRVTELDTKLSNKCIKVEKNVCNYTRPILLRGCKIQKRN